MNRLTLSLCLLLAGFAWADTKPVVARLITDKGEKFLHFDASQPVAVGAELNVVADEKKQKVVGKAVVMEVNGQLARLSLDDGAQKLGKFALIPPPQSAPAAPAAPAAPVAAPAPAAKPPSPADLPPPSPALSGTLDPVGLHVAWQNRSDQNWTQCELRYSDARFYKIGDIPKHSEENVLKVKFSSPPEPLYDHVTVTCAEGQSDFYFGKPNAPVGSLKGYAVDDKGHVTVYNQSGSPWSACDVKKPNASHYVLGELRANDQDHIDKGRFKAEAQPPVKWIDLRCAEGGIRLAL